MLDHTEPNHCFAFEAICVQLRSWCRWFWSSRWFGRNGDVIKLTMGKDGRMAVPQQSCARLLDPGRFRAAARRVGS